MTETLRELLAAGQPIRAVGAHDGLSALLVQAAGFEAVWAGGLCISTAHGVPDAGILTMTEFHADAVRMRRAVDIPIIADVDAGFGDVNVVRRMAQLYESSGIDAVCIEDKQYPKRNSFRNGHRLEDPEVFAQKIHVMKSVQTTPDFLVIARLESLIAGGTVDEAIDRADLYCRAGADAVLIHSRQRTPDEVGEFCAGFRQLGHVVPVFVVPTTYYSADVDRLSALGAAGMIYANQIMRGAVTAMKDVLESLAATGSTAEMESTITTVDDLFQLVDTDSLHGNEPWHGLSKIS